MATKPRRSRAKALSKARIAQIKTDITKTLRLAMPAASSLSVSSLTQSLHAVSAYDHRIKGKLYEASALSNLCDLLHNKESMTLKLVNGNYVVLNQKGGAVDHTQDPWIEVWDVNDILIGEIWMNIEFLTMSHNLRPTRHSVKSNADYHELDIALIKPRVKGKPYKPEYKEVLLGAECKCTKVTKDIIRSVLGLRRELSMLTPNKSISHFMNWSTNHSKPNSVLLLYSSSNMSLYNSLNNVFDIYMINHQL